jgi:hypothetical protein
MILLFTVWLVFGNALVKVPNDDSVTGNLTRIVSYLGTPGTLAVLVFIAYVVGMIATTHAWLDVVEGRSGGKIANTVSKPNATRFNKFLEDLAEGSDKVASPEDVIKVLKLENEPKFRLIPGLPDAGHRHRELVKQLPPYIENYVQSDLKVLAAQLHSKHDKTWEKYEKASSEANFRASMVIPLILMTFALGWRMATEGNLPLMFAMIGVMIGVMIAVEIALVLKAIAKRKEANEEIIHAILIGDIDVPPITTIKGVSGQ